MFTMTGRPRNSELDIYQDFILDQLSRKESLTSILSYLRETHQIQVSLRTLSRRLKEWNAPQRRVYTVKSPGIEEALRHHFFERGASDDQLVSLLRRDGFTVSKTGVVKLRRSMDIYRRHDETGIEIRLAELRAFFDTPSPSQVLLPLLGRRALPVFLRQNARLHIPERPLFKAVQEMYPQECRARLDAIRRRRGGFTLPGPNCVWSVDGYCKLERFGFEIYAAIDAYSRYILWAFVGDSARTERAVAEQYLTAVKEHGFTPLVVRSDKGVETTTMAGLHFLLAQGSKSQRPLKPRRNATGQVEFVLPGEGDEPNTYLDASTIDPTIRFWGRDRPLGFKDVWS